MADPTFFNPWDDIRYTKNRLPHWQQPGATYFVTFHLADALPKHVLERHREDRAVWLRLHPEPWAPETEREYHRRFSAAIERWLDAGHGSCALRRRDVAVIVAASLAYFDGIRYYHHSWVIMPNHVHLLFSLHADWQLEQVLHSWKSFTAHRLVEVEGTPKPFWQIDYFDRLTRDEKHFRNCIRYIRRNPEKARLKPAEFILHEGEDARSVE